MKKLAVVMCVLLMPAIVETGAQTSRRGGVRPDAALAAQLAYVKFDGIDGEARDNNHMGWSDLASFSQSLHKPDSATGATRRRGDVVLEDILLVKRLDKSSPKLAEAVCKGKVFPKVEIHVTAYYGDAGRVTYYAYELTNAAVTSYTIDSATSKRNIPMEEISLNFEEIKVTYTEMDSAGKAKGNIEYTWKVEEGR